MKQKMKAVIFTGKEDLHLDEVEVPEVKRKDDVIIETRVCGVCATDVHTYRGEFISEINPYPLIPGHEVSGVVVKTASETSQIKVGDKVAIDPFLSTCGECYYCLNNRYNHCPEALTLGTNVAGGFARYIRVPASSLSSFKKASFSEASLAEPLATVIYGQKRSEIDYSDSVLIIGAGPIGLLHLQMAQLSGSAKIVVVDLDEERLKKAEKLGADRIVSARITSDISSKKRKEILQGTADDGYEVVIEATGVPEVVETSIDFLMSGGRLLVFGVAPHDSSVSFNPYEIYRRDYKIIGAFALKNSLDKSMRLIDSGKLNLDPVIGESFSLENIETALKLVDKGKNSGKVQICFPG